MTHSNREYNLKNPRHCGPLRMRWTHQLLLVGMANIASPCLAIAGDLPGRRALADCLRNFGDGIGCQIPRRGDYAFDCAFNDRPIPCSGYRNGIIRWADGTTTKIWFLRYATNEDKARMSTKKIVQLAPYDRAALYTDSRRGIWIQILIPNGNTQWINEATRNKIFIPLRATCQPPLRGQIGYCSPPR